MSERYKTRSKEHLINLIKNHSKDTPNFALLIGAGASISSGVKPTKKMIEDWRKQEYANSQSTEPYSDWLRKQKWFGAPEEYSLLFERVYDEPAQRRIYIEDCVKNATPFWGYIYLSDMISHNYFNVIFTPNFDDLLNESCFVYANCKPIVCSHDSAVSGIRITSKRPKIIKLHGDFLYDNIKNTLKETDTLEKNMRDKFSAFASEYGLIVIGYGGNDRSIMDTLELLLRSGGYFPHGLYWCLKKESQISGYLERFLSRERVYVVEIDDFDDFMAEIHCNLGLVLPMVLSFPYEAITARLNRFLRFDQDITSKVISRDISGITRQIKKFEKALGTAYSPTVSPIPYTFLAHRELDSGNFNEGIEYLEKALFQSKDKFYILKALFKGYAIKCNMDKVGEITKELEKIATTAYEKRDLAELMSILDPKKALETLDSIEKNLLEPESYHINRAAILFRLEKYDDALAEAELAISELPEDFCLKITKLSILKAIGAKSEVEKISKEILSITYIKDELIGEFRQELSNKRLSIFESGIINYCHAVAFGALGDKAKMLVLLEKSLLYDRLNQGFEALFSPDFFEYRTDTDFTDLFKKIYKLT